MVCLLRYINEVSTVILASPGGAIKYLDEDNSIIKGVPGSRLQAPSGDTEKSPLEAVEEYGLRSPVAVGLSSVCH